MILFSHSSKKSPQKCPLRVLWARKKFQISIEFFSTASKTSLRLFILSPGGLIRAVIRTSHPFGMGLNFILPHTALLFTEILACRIVVVFVRIYFVCFYTGFDCFWVGDNSYILPLFNLTDGYEHSPSDFVVGGLMFPQLQNTPSIQTSPRPT